jgi:hypothetical protein
MKFVTTLYFRIVLSSLWFLPFVLHAQRTLSPGDIIHENLKLYSFQTPYAGVLDYYSLHNTYLPIIDKVNFRTETNQLDFYQQRYQLRFNFNTFGEREAMYHLTTAMRLKYQIRQKNLLRNTLRDIYQDLISLYFLREEQVIDTVRINIVKDLRRVYQKMLRNNSDFKLNDWLENEEDIMQSEIAILKNKESSEAIIKRLRLDSIDGVLTDFEGWISIESIRNYIFSLKMDEDAAMDSEMDIVREEIAGAEYELEKAKGRKVFDFVQFQYKRNDKWMPGEQISIGASFDIPLGMTNRADINKAAIKWLEEQDRRMIQEKQKRRELKKRIDKMDILMKQYDVFVRFVEEQKLEETYEAYLETNTISPLVLLKIRKIILSQKKKKKSIEHEIFKVYLDILFRSGVLVQMPLRNYLLENQPVLK